MKCSILQGALVLFLLVDFAVNSEESSRNVDSYPEITHFPHTDLLGAGDVNEGETLKIPCKARGTKPLTHTWYLNKRKIDVHGNGSSCSLDSGGSLVCRNIKSTGKPQTYQCFVSNHYGKVFSPELKVDVTAITMPFHSGPSGKQTTMFYTTSSPLFVYCPYHRTHLGANYTWGVYSSMDGKFVPLRNSRAYGVTNNGLLAFSAAKKSELSKPLHCRISVGTTNYISRPFGFSKSLLSFVAPSTPPSLAERPSDFEKALRGSTKIMKCIPVGYPIPRIKWWKDGQVIVSGRYNMKLQSFDRILVIKNVNENQHTGTYKCGTAHKNESILQELAKTKLVVTGPPIITKLPPKALTAFEGKSFSLESKARLPLYPRLDALYYEWYKNGKKVPSIWGKNAYNGDRSNLTVSALSVTEDSGVYQCVIMSLNGKTITATKVNVKVITCGEIAPPPYSKFKEDICHKQSSFVPRTTCSVVCNRGFFGHGRRDYTECLDDGRWLPLQYKCKDIEPPRIKKGHKCPKSIVIATQRYNDKGQEVTWNPPVAEDNSGKVVTKVEPPGINGKSDWFPLGLNPIKYTFRDASGLNVSCHFNISVFPRTKIITKPHSKVTILKHKPLELNCIANSDPSLLYIWKKSSLTKPNKMITIKKESNAHVQVLDGGKRLVMRHVKDVDAGKYTCEVINRHYNVSGSRDFAVTSVEVVKEIEWSPWKKWTSCVGKACGHKGHKTRRRECLKKDSIDVAIGCEGNDTQRKSCTVFCTTQKPSTITTPTTDKNLLDISSIKNVITKYNKWFKSHYPNVFHYLNTRTGKIAFACVLSAAGVSIVLICWSCSHYISRRRKRQRMGEYAEDDDIDSEQEPLRGEEEVQLDDQYAGQAEDQDLNEALYGAQQMENYGTANENYPEGYNYYFDHDGYDEGEVVYEMTG